MGGIKFEHITELTSNGTRRIAVVTALTRASDIAGETGRWSNAIDRQVSRN
jgi:thiamine monophosphate synthase